ncbi:DUF2325 domain-containing protein [Ectobacillus sp. JY-23]|uniref:DUF2325 domain-containing protein n=1 Tax=Ectobacillus sp. JY-23 TaxID=2933872 RepID=UPI001FF57A50|nr:DUF2325 domain-containing protein [Ectobacillus sp. JY-23]UOY93360.1 DUF2325 domain-containing protein [Ectobacillus sp. JY-23]
MQQELFEKTAQAMQERLQHLNPDNISCVEKEIHAYFHFLHALLALPQPLTVETNPQPQKVSPVYRFERQLRGGLLPELSAFVPEYIVRQFNLSHGDLIHAKRIDDGSESPRYLYTLAQAMGQENKERIELNYCIVEYDPSLRSFVTNRQADGKLIKIDEAPQTIMLPEKDIKDLDIKSGDVIDVAYLKSNPNMKRIVWKYDISEIPCIKHTVKIEKQEKKEKKEVEKTLAGKTILMLGFEPERAAFEREVVSRGGQFLFLSGDEPKASMQASLCKADAAVFMLQHISHDATYWATECCKQARIPFKGVHSFGRSMFVRTAEELVGSK